MSDQHSVIQFDWPVGSKDPWRDLQNYIDKQMARNKLIPAREYACMVTATFTMKANGDKYHTGTPTLTTLADKLMETLHESGVVLEAAVTQLNIGKVLPGPNAVKTTPGVRISIMVMGG